MEGDWPIDLDGKFKRMDPEDHVSLQALAGLVSYLKHMMIDDTTFELVEFVEFDYYDLVSSKKNLIIDPIAM